MLDIFCCPLADVDATLLKSYRDFLSDDERERLLLFKREAAAQTFIVSRALLRTVLAERVGCTPQSLRFERDANDKPQLADYLLQFNLSHSDGWIALAVSAEGAVGVDIETSVRRNNILGIAKRFFLPDEFEMLTALPECARAEKFCELWTVKEACVKWSGLGIGRALAGVGVRIDNGVIALSLRDDVAGGLRPQAVLLGPTPALRLAVVGTWRNGLRLMHKVPLVSAQPLPWQPLARTSDQFEAGV